MPECRTVRHPVSPVPEWPKIPMLEPARYRNKKTQSGTGMLRYRNEIQDAGLPAAPSLYWPHLQSCTKFCRARDLNSCPDQESQNCNHYVLNVVDARNAVLCSIKNHISDKWVNIQFTMNLLLTCGTYKCSQSMVIPNAALRQSRE